MRILESVVVALVVACLGASALPFEEALGRESALHFRDLMMNPPYSDTVAEAIAAQGCETVVCATLSQQTVNQTNCIVPGLFSNLNNVSNLTMSSSCAAVPFLQSPAVSALQDAIDDNGVPMSINSALRTDVQQLMLYVWYLEGLCGISSAAKPGQSTHNSGLAVDVNDYSIWIDVMAENDFKWLGSSDPVHFTYQKGIDIAEDSVLAFQELWNANTPQYQIWEDGLIGPQTIAAMLASPVNGFPKGATC